MTDKKMTPAFLISATARGNNSEASPATPPAPGHAMRDLSRAIMTDIATLYCTKPGHAVKTVPPVDIDNFDKWGTYHVPIYTITLNEMTREADFDPDVYDGLRQLAADMSVSASFSVEFSEDMDFTVFHFKDINTLVESCQNLIDSEDFPKCALARQNLLHKLDSLRRCVLQELVRDERLPFAYSLTRQ